MRSGLREKVEALSSTAKSMLADMVNALPVPKRNETPEQKDARLNAFERDALPVRSKTQWQLNRIDDIAWIQNRSGVYVYINYDVKTESIRLDIMAIAQLPVAEPLQSFVGKADNVRKAAMQWFAARIAQKAGLGVSLEHAAYIGAELERCDTERIDYIQS